MSEEVSRPLTAAEELEMQARFLRMLKRQAELYTSGESSSLHEDVARAILSSVRFSLRLYFTEKGLPFTEILHQDIEKILPAAEEMVCRKVKRARFQYQRACRCVCQRESLALVTTIAGIGDFFRRYDPRFFAAECPCDIDYPLAHPLPETLEGVVYLRAYLDRLLLEDAFLRRFSQEAVCRLLDEVLPGHQELLVNLYETVAVGALGVTMAEGDLFTLGLTLRQQETLVEELSALLPSQREERLSRAGKVLARRLGLNGAEEGYLLETAESLVPRLGAALDGGGVQTLFPVLGR